MHETAVVEGLLRILAGQAAAHGVTRIVSVHLKVGRMRGLDPRQLRGAFEIFAEETIAAGARLDVDVVPIEACCRGCAHRWVVPGWNFECPNCGGTDADIVAGRELHVESFEAAGESPRVPDQPP